MDQSTPGPPVFHCLPKLCEIHVGSFGDTVQPSHEKRRLPGKDPNVGKVQRQEEKGTTEVGQCHRSNQYEFDTTPGGSGRQEGLACSGPWGHEVLDTTKRLNNNKWDSTIFASNRNLYSLFLQTAL